MAWWMCRRRAAASSSLSVSRCRIAVKSTTGRAIKLSSMAWLTVKLDVSGSGSAATSRCKVGTPQETNPSGGLLRTTRRRFFGSSPALARAFSFSTTCSGACTTTLPVVSYPARPARDLVELARLQQPGLRPVVLGQGGEDDRPDGHVDAYPQGVRPEDDLEQASLG